VECLSSGRPGLFTLLAGMMSLVFVTLAMVRRHISPIAAKPAVAYATARRAAR
jgi:hypothetical protein